MTMQYHEIAALALCLFGMAVGIVAMFVALYVQNGIGAKPKPKQK